MKGFPTISTVYIELFAYIRWYGTPCNIYNIYKLTTTMILRISTSFFNICPKNAIIKFVKSSKVKAVQTCNP